MKFFFEKEENTNRFPDAGEEIVYYDCSDRNPCGYGDGECASDGDCDTEYKCGVNNCGSFVAGQAGSCCVVLTNTTVSPAVSTERVPAQWSNWGAWASSTADWGRLRGRVFWQGHDCEGCDVTLEV